MVYIYLQKHSSLNSLVSAATRSEVSEYFSKMISSELTRGV